MIIGVILGLSKGGVASCNAESAEFVSAFDKISDYSKNVDAEHYRAIYPQHTLEYCSQKLNCTVDELVDDWYNSTKDAMTDIGEMSCSIRS